MKKNKAIKPVVDNVRMRQVERDLACLQVELAAMGERVDMVEGENKALRAMLLSRSENGLYWHTPTGGAQRIDLVPSNDYPFTTGPGQRIV